MRGLFPRYHGPLSNKTVLVLGTEELCRRGLSSLATSASAASSQIDSASFASSKKEPPLGLPLGRLGSLVKTRFLEVLLHSQTPGLGKSSKIFPLPTSRDQISSFFCSAQACEVDWVQAICLGLNSYWGGPLFNEGEVNLFHGKLLENFLHDVHRISELKDTVDEFDWNSFSQCRTID